MDVYGKVLLFQTHKPLEEHFKLTQKIIEHTPDATAILHKQKLFEQGKFSFKINSIKGDIPIQPFIVKENNLAVEIQLTNKIDTGIYLDAINFRKWLLKNSNGLRILNLFSYTCTLAVAAMKGGAFDVINVDSSKSALASGKKNYELNDLYINSRSFAKIRVNDFIRFAKKKKDLYDLIIIDPSPPPTSCKTIEEKFQYYQRLIEKSLPLLKQGGKLAISSHQISLPEEEDLLPFIKRENSNLNLEEKIPYPSCYLTSHPKFLIFSNTPGTIPEVSIN